MAEKSPQTPKQPARPRLKRPRLDLPFRRRKRDWATWIYDNRGGISVTLIVYLLVAIVFVGSRIVVKAPAQTDGIVLDLRTLEELEQQKQRLEREVRLRQAEARDANAPISNAISNQNAELRDDRNTDMSTIRDRAEGLDSRINANREAWEQGMREIEAMRNAKDEGKDASKTDRRAKGRVLVSFSLANPTRYGDNIVVPGYRCENGGEVVVDITVGRSGEVVGAAINRELSDNDPCMHQTALEATRRSRFNPDSSAPERQTGTITYLFIPQ
ncbi:MAG: energy transducer TonB [Rikenellaceae bacterium]|jgi:TonB family protein|nr:energy transducer TonB [Rikenellaceae bacterium]